MYHLSALLITILTFVSGLRVLAQTVTTLAFDTTYDDSTLSLDRVACSDGTNGLKTKGYTTLGSLPTFPNVGGVYAVTGYNSAQCGACYAVTYGNTTLNILAVDVSKEGFTISQAAMNDLTGNQAVALGRVDVSFLQTSGSACGLSS